MDTSEMLKLATERPWRLDRFEGNVKALKDRHVASANGFTTNTDGGKHVDENNANAALIVRAVNSYEKMREALKALSDYQELYENQAMEHGRMPGNDYYNGLAMGIVVQARAAIALAEGE